MKMAAAVRFGKHLKELRLHLCQTSVASQGVRDFINGNYVTMKKANPEFPILIRECSGVQPVVHARYEFGREEKVVLSGKSAAEVLKTIEQLNSQK